MKNIRELIIEYILFTNDNEELMAFYALTPSELEDLNDVDLLELYDTILLSDPQI